MLCSRASRAAAALVVLGVVCTQSPAALAYCITHTCSAESSDEPCDWEDGCEVGGEPLQWNRSCISFSVHERGSPLRGISVEDASQVIGAAFYQWTHVDCDPGHPSLEVYDVSPVACGATEFDLLERNANIWVFRDKQWPYDDSNTLALTTVTFDPNTGQIHDTDVEVNTADHTITVGDENVGFDLASIATHEVGHVLGLGHSNDSDATMYLAYDPGSVSTRWLHIDDVRAICEALPPDREVGECDPFPETGFSPECHGDRGCFSIATPNRSNGTTLGLLLLGALLLRRARRRREAASR